ncbi:fatty acid-binding protein 2-like [Bicyclus anynana]|uniref:Fatty acid-binding protein 2-like n=1 Tax=Bicyclus anynana TaxID=110368 RepID=A0A6J1NXM6_BICAN|nr:fatty acid-binding protein 2-like [Bicyclus anynana]
MSFLGVTYVHDKDENFKEFLAQLPIPEEKTEAFLTIKPKTKIEKDGDSYTITSTYPTGDRTATFESGVEFEEKISDDLSAQTTYTVEDNVVTQVQKYPDGKSITYKREYSDIELVVTLTFSDWDGEAKRYYVAE